MSRAKYAALFAVIGTAWGAGNGTTTFNIPDLQGRVPIGAGTGSGLSPRGVGGTGGAEEHTLTNGQMPVHGHPFHASYTSQSSPQTQTTGGFMTSTASDVTKNANLGAASAAQGEQIGAAGGGSPHNNMQPFAVVNWLIKT